MIFCCPLGSISDTRSWCSDLPYGPGGSRRFRSSGCSSKYFASPPVWCPLFGLDGGRQYRRDPPVAPALRHAHGVARLVGHHRHPLVAFPPGPAAPVVCGPVYVRVAPLAVRVVLVSGSVWVWPCLCSCSLPGQRSADLSAHWSPADHGGLIFGQGPDTQKPYICTRTVPSPKAETEPYGFTEYREWFIMFIYINPTQHDKWKEKQFMLSCCPLQWWQVE